MRKENIFLVCKYCSSNLGFCKLGKIELSPRGAGKVKEGQFVNVKFDNFPYMEYGISVFLSKLKKNILSPRFFKSELT